MQGIIETFTIRLYKKKGVEYAMSNYWKPFTRESKKIFLNLSSSAIDVLDYLLDEITFNDKQSKALSYTEIANAVQKHRPNVIRAIKELSQKKKIYVRRDGLKRMRISINIVLGTLKADSINSDTMQNSDSINSDTTRSIKSDTSNGINSDTITLLDNNKEEDNNKDSVSKLQNGVVEKLNQVRLFHYEKKDSDGYFLPKWMDTETWEEYLAMRVRLKKPPTPAAKKKLINKMERICNDLFKGDLSKHTEILNESIMNSWTGVFAPKINNLNKTFADREKERRENAIRDFHKALSKVDGVVQ